MNRAIGSLNVRRIRGKKTDGPVSRYLNRPLSTRITRIIVEHEIPLTPNQVSLISFGLSLAAALLAIIRGYVAAGILVQLSSIIDGVDGELARALNKTSRRGGFLDAVLDRMSDIAIIASASYSAILATTVSPSLILLLAILAVAGDLLVSYVHARGEATLKIHPALIGKIPQFASRDVRLLVIAMGLIVASVSETLLLYTLAVIAILGFTYTAAKTIDILVHYQE